MTTIGLLRWALPSIAALALPPLMAGCGRTTTPSQPCRVTAATGAHLDVRIRGGSIDVSQLTADGMTSLASVGPAQAEQGTLVFVEGDTGSVVLVLGPSAMTRVHTSDGGDADASRCVDASITAAAVRVAADSPVTVVGFDATGAELFRRNADTTDAGVVAPVGSPP